jgi:hypothetical protein
LARYVKWIVLAVGLGALFPTPSAGDEDALLKIRPDGLIEGLPEEYGPVYLRVEYHRSFPWLHRDITVELAFGQLHRTLPACLARLFLLPERESMTASGSWNHVTDLRPPYLTIELPQESKPTGFLRGYSITFDLISGAVAYIWENRPLDGVQYVEPIELRSLCTPEEAAIAIQERTR